MSLGPLMIDLVGAQISDVEKTLLLKPEVGGVILFTRNYESPQQLTQLVAEIHALRSPPLLVAVDHEGGRVQRFREGFTGFAPVLDLAHGVSGVIGDRAFARNPGTVATLAYAFMHGMLSAGMQAVGKHFPGHGAVVEDSHIAMPVDHRDLETILAHDVIPFERMIENGLAGIMPAHVIYDKVDSKPAGYSDYWLNTILRGQLKFQGVIFSDDLSMEAAGIAGGYGERAQAALSAGCDMALVCNHTEGAMAAAEHLKGYLNPTSQVRLMRMHGKQEITREALQASEKWQQAVTVLSSLVDSPELEMDV